eukprot:1177168-Pyramimonas_sp.AAC.1
MGTLLPQVSLWVKSHTVLRPEQVKLLEPARFTVSSLPIPVSPLESILELLDRPPTLIARPSF